MFSFLTVLLVIQEKLARVFCLLRCKNLNLRRCKLPRSACFVDARHSDFLASVMYFGFAFEIIIVKHNSFSVNMAL